MGAPPNANWNYPTSVRFGAGRLAELPAACDTLGIRRPLLVTDRGLASAAMTTQALQALASADKTAGLFSDVQGNPVGENVEAGVRMLREGGHDGVVALGGGSALDAGKAIAMMAGQLRPLWDFEDREDWYTRVDTAAMVPVVAIPTTAGTGSEVGRASVITDERTHTKKIIFHPRMLPALVILDPLLTVALPARITAATGMDALSHCLEAWCAPGFHPMADGIALEGMRLVREWLPRAVADGTDVAARAHMLVASSMGATAFQKGLGAMHSLSHPLGARLDLHHGLCNAVVMPYVLDWNRAAIGERASRLARYLDLPGTGVDALIDWVLALRASTGIPHTLGEIGVRDDHAAALAPEALADPSTGGNPVAIDESGFRELYLRCIRGELRA